MTDARLTVLCAAADPVERQRLGDALDRVGGDACAVEAFADGAALRARAAELARRGTPVPVVFVDEDLADGLVADALIAFATESPGRVTRTVLLGGGDQEHPARAVRAGALDSVVPKPWTDASLEATLDAHVTRFYLAE